MLGDAAGSRRLGHYVLPSSLCRCERACGHAERRMTGTSHRDSLSPGSRVSCKLSRRVPRGQRLLGRAVPPKRLPGCSSARRCVAKGPHRRASARSGMRGRREAQRNTSYTGTHEHLRNRSGAHGPRGRVASHGGGAPPAAAAQDIRRPPRAVWPLGPSAVLEAEGQERRLLRVREAHVRARKAAGADAELLWTEANPPACA